MRRSFPLLRRFVPVLVLAAFLAAFAPAQEVVAWGDSGSGESDVPASAQSGVIALGGGNAFSLALKSDGSIVGWGDNQFGQLDVPESAQSGVTALAAGEAHSLALKSDGSVVAWGDNSLSQLNVPASALSGVAAISAGAYHSLALKSDGGVVAWGYNGQGQCTVPTSARSNVVAIAGGDFHSLALKSDGSVVAWGSNSYGQRTIPAGLSGVIAIAGGNSFSVAVKSDGTVVAWGYNAYGQTNVPAALSGVVAVSAGVFQTLALKSDGSVVGWGNNDAGQLDVPAGLVASRIEAGGYHSLALRAPIAALATLSLAPSSIWSGDASVGTVTLTGAAPAGGAQVALSTSLSGVAVPSTVTVAAGATSATFPITSSLRFGTDVTRSVTATYGSASTSANLTVKGYVATVAFDHPDLIGGSTNSLFLKVTLSVARDSDTVFNVSSTGPLSSVPATVTVLAGATEGKVALTSSQVTASQSATATVFYGGSAVGTASLQVLPNKATLKFAVDKVSSGEGTTGTVYLTAATIGSVTVGLSSGDASLTVPSSVTVAAGARTATFPISTTPTLRTLDVPITATVGSASVSKDLRVSAAVSVKSVSGPSMYGGGAATFTVTLSRAAGPGGYALSLSSDSGDLSVPSSVTVLEGATTATFVATASDVEALSYPTVTATSAVNAASVPVTLRANVPAAFTLSASTVASGGSVTGTVTLKAVVAVDTVVQLSSGDPLVTVPATVTILAGSKTATFAATAGTTAKSKNVTLTASKNGVSVTKGVKVLP